MYQIYRDSPLEVQRTCPNVFPQGLSNTRLHPSSLVRLTQILFSQKSLEFQKQMVICRSIEMLTASVNSCALARLTAQTISCILSAMFSVTAVFGPPGSGASLTLVLRRLSSFTQG